MPSRTVSIVMPIYNEESLLSELFDRMTRVLNGLETSTGLAGEWVIVNDGSHDRTLEILRGYATKDPRLAVIDLSRNFGHQPAIQAGLEYAHGDAIIIMDGDLQDPPELIPDLVRTWLRGPKVVVAKRRSRAERGLKGMLFKLFHSMLARVSDLKMETGSGVFGLIDRRVANEMIRLRERNRFFPGLRSWVGYEQADVIYDREKRASGEPKQTFGRLVRYAFDAIFSFSLKPLRAIWTLGFIVSIFSIAYALYLLILRVFHIDVVPGFTTPTVAILLLGGIQLISIGILGEYLGRIYDEVKQRPHYVINEIITTSSELVPGVVAQHTLLST
ncbi:MAG: glycosyltransferase family 2 protein [Bacteroidota bacterium]|nr:glycosyltransferase family 2 protein [Bacteroidota bacterium]MDP4232872.1 glycosyltransferase family 2 protein [Bacteroidota bacterium]MDP4241916.1 glycosyltransferase family 2 protein [Bacteroidota bacterium]MDP4288242.1 glycosyltransferase family 2 protein [Bacteroidota bacterium]